MTDIVQDDRGGGAFSVIQGGDDRPDVILTEELKDVAEAACVHLARDSSIFQRGGLLVHVIQPSPVSPGARSIPMVRELPLPTLRVCIAQVARWVKWDAKGSRYKRVACPETISSAVFSRGQWDSVRPLIGVVSSPTVRPDGTVLQRPGYDPATQLLYAPNARFVDVLDEPTLEDAQGAASALLELVSDFPFATDNDRSAWLASLLTLVGRAAITGPVPLFAIDANTPGSGKSRLADLALVISHGIVAPRSPFSNVDEEVRKQITSVLLEGSPAALIDNVRSGSTFGGAAFDALLTSDVWRDRNLGKTQSLTLPARVVWFATGNNLRFGGDLTRRSIRIRLESPLERPEQRSDFKIPNLLRHAEKQRHRLVASAITILRAHAVAGRPPCGANWGSYESWSRVIASAIRWIGLPDPLACCATESEEANEDVNAFSAVADALEAIGRPVAAREILAELFPHSRDGGDLFPSYAPAREALESMAPRGVVDVRMIGNFLRRARGRQLGGGRSITSLADGHTRTQVWRVNVLAPKPV